MPMRDRLQISLLILSKFNQISYFLSPLGFLMISEGLIKLIRLNLLNGALSGLR